MNIPIIERVRVDIIRGDDGFAMYWPETPKGYLTAEMLRLIAEELDKINKPAKHQLEIDMEAFNTGYKNAIIESP